MSIATWLKHWSAAVDRRKHGTTSRAVASAAEHLEVRSLLSTSVLIVAGSELNITLNVRDNVSVSSLGGNVIVQIGPDGGQLQPVAIGTLAASSVQSIVITGGDAENTIDLSGVTSAAFTGLTSISVNGGNGNDSILGSDDFGDSLVGGDGADTLDGQGADNTLDGADGADVIRGGIGIDSISGGDGADNISAGDGNDTINSGNGSDTVNAGNGNDFVLGANGEDILNGDDGDDTLNGDGGSDTINGSIGNDSILGGELADSLLGGDGADTIDGQTGNDVIDGQAGDDSLLGSNGNDRIQGGDGNDVVSGNAGMDTLEGGLGSDRLLGGSNNDLMFDDSEIGLSDFAGADSIFGQSGNDTIFALNGPDYVDGGAGNDLVDNRTTTVSVNDVRLDPEGNSSTTNMVFTISLSNALTRPVTVTYATSDGTATRTVGGANPQNNEDYIAVSGTVNFAPGEIAKTVSVPILGDTLDESDQETLFLNLISATNATIFDNSGEGRIIDDDGAASQDLDIVLLLDNTRSFSNIGPSVQAAFSSVITQLQMNFPGASLAFGVTRFEAYGGVQGGGGGGGGGGNSGLPFALNQPLITTTTPQFQNAIDAALARVAPNRGAGAEPIFEGLYQITTGVGLDGNDDGDMLDTGSAGLVSTQLALGPDIPAFSTFQADPTGPVLSPTSNVANPADGIGFRPGTRRIVLAATDSRLLIHNNDGLPFYTGVGGVTVPASVFATGAGGPGGGGGGGGGGSLRTPIAAVGIQATLNALLADNVQVVGLGASQRGSTTPRAELTALATLTGGLNNTTGPISDGAGGTIQPGQPLFFEVQAGNSVALANAIVSAVTGSSTTPPPPPPPPPPPLVPPSVPQGDTIVGSDGDDTLFGGTFDDIISGGAGNDSVDAGDGNDSVLGGSGADKQFGQAGDDTLNGQGGPDVIQGGDGNDTVIWEGASSGNDQLTDLTGDNTLIVNGNGTANNFVVGKTAEDLLIITESGKSVTVGPNFNRVAINGNNGNDTITIGNLEDVAAVLVEVFGGNGDDTINAIGAFIGNVRLSLNGDAGNDTLVGSEDGDTISGGVGHDFLYGGSGDDTMIGGNGKDNLYGQAGNDSLQGNADDDSLRGNDGNDTLEAGDGFDLLLGQNGDDSLNGGAGDDRLDGSAGADTLLGNLGIDTLTGGDGNDSLDGGRHDDVITAGTGNDFIRGDHGHDFIDAGDGDDTVIAGDGNDTVTGGLGNDQINGSDGDDNINSGSGNDTVLGGDGADTLAGGGGNDVVLGGDGDDSINGQGGSDTVAGNQGVDTIADPANEINEAFTLSNALLTALEAI